VYVHVSHNMNNVSLLLGVVGTITEARILADTTGQSRGCGFVRFTTQVSNSVSGGDGGSLTCVLTQTAADQAVSGMNGTTVAGCTKPLVVRLADSTKKQLQAASTGRAPTSMPVVPGAAAGGMRFHPFAAPPVMPTMPYATAPTFNPYVPVNAYAQQVQVRVRLEDVPRVHCAFRQLQPQPATMPYGALMSPMMHAAVQPVMPVMSTPMLMPALAPVAPPMLANTSSVNSTAGTGGATKSALFVYNVPPNADEAWLRQLFTVNICRFCVWISNSVYSRTAR
jgi:hypothetical protein